MGLAKEYARSLDRVVVIAPGSMPKTDIAPNVKIELVGNVTKVSANGSVAPICLSIWAACRVYAALRDVDVVHIHEPFAPVLAWTTLLCVGRQRIVATFHRYSESLGDIFFAPWTRLLTRGIDVCIAVSPEAAKTAHVLSAAHPLIVPNGIAVRPLDVVRTVQERIVFIGRHESRKGLEVLLRAHDLIRDHVCLEIVGTGEQTKDLVQKYPECSRRKWRGVVDDAERDTLLQTSSMYCVPSLSGESFGIVLLEAMIQGASVIASDIPGYRGVCPAGAARLVAPDDPFALSQAILEDLVEFRIRRDTWDKRRHRAWEHASTFDMRTVASEYLKLFCT
jgi:phosphatidylinositol alpha-mannosyltransferase